MSTKFSILECLNVSTGRLLTEMDDIYRVMGHVVDDPHITTIGLAACADQAKKGILSACPELIVPTEEVLQRFKDGVDDIPTYLHELKAQYGHITVEVPAGCGKNDPRRMRSTKRLFQGK